MKRIARKSTQKMRRVRGGAFAPSQSRRVSRPQGMTSIIKAEIRKTANRSKDPLRVAGEEMLKAAAYSASVKIGSAIVDVAKDSLLRDGNNVATIENHRVVKTKKSDVLTGMTYKTSFQSGKPSTSTVLRVERNNGCRKFNYFDTMASATTVTERNELSPIWGFNQKGVIWYDNKSYWSYADLFSFMNFTSYIRPTTKSQTSYLLTKNFGVETKIMNQNKYTNAKVTVHWVRQLLNGESPKTRMGRCFFTGPSLPTSADVQANTIPYNLQNQVLTQSGGVSVTAMDPIDGSLYKSPNFREDFEVVKTMTKVLKPGDVWEIDYKHHTGPGLVLEDMFDKYTDRGSDSGFNENAAAFYYPIFTAHGPQVEAFESTSPLGQNSFIGTAPAALHFEFRKYGEIVQSSSNVGEAPSGGSSVGGFTSTNWAIRTFTKPGPLFATNTVGRRAYVDIQNILATGEPALAGKYVIPVTTEYFVDRGGRPNLS